MKLTLDNEKQVFFYEQDYYVLSNFSAFSLRWKDIRFDTSEAAYHWEKFPGLPIQRDIVEAMSAHDAFKLAEQYKTARRKDWEEVKVDIMRDILRAKAVQHEYVRRKLMASGDRELIENSWRDNFWGWGENRDGQNMLGKLWMEIRAELSSPASVNEDHGEAGLPASGGSTITIKGKLTMKDGRIPTVANMRRCFEQAVNDTPVLKKNTPLGIMEINGKFSHYMHPDTDTLWIGFALGMRCSQRIDDAMLSNDQAMRPANDR